MTKKFSFIDLFAGIGGFHIAMESFGGECVYASEWDKHASTVYEKNFHIKPDGDITKVDEKNIPAHDVLCAGFPCQAFSISGKQRGFEDTRGTLFFDVARIVNYHHPKVVFLENVKNLLRHDDGKTFAVIKSTMENLGYDVFYKIMNASDYGLPQNRERLIVVCLNRELNAGTFRFPQPKNIPICVQDILEDNPDIKMLDREDVVFYKTYDPKFDFNGKEILPNKPVQIGRVGKGGQGERIYHIHGHGITLSAYGGGPGAKTGLFQTSEGVRKLTPRECARMQGFPDTFQYAERKTQAYQQFGNSVPINVLKAVAEEFLKLI